MINTVLEEAKKIADQTKNISPEKKANYLEKAQKILLDYLKKHPKDTQAWLLLARIECNSPLDDYDRIAEYANHVLQYDPSNAYALLFLSYADYYLRGSLDDNLYANLSMAYSDNPEIMSMVEVAKARHFEFRDKEQYEKALVKSIEYCSKHASNFYLLGDFYIKQGKIKEGNLLREKGFENAGKIENDIDDYYPTNLEKFFKYFFAFI